MLVGFLKNSVVKLLPDLPVTAPRKGIEPSCSSSIVKAIKSLSSWRNSVASHHHHHYHHHRHHHHFHPWIGSPLRKGVGSLKARQSFVELKKPQATGPSLMS